MSKEQEQHGLPSREGVRKYLGPIIFVWSVLALVVACAVSPTQAQDAPGKPMPGVEKYDAPNGFPALLTYCLYGTRLFEAYTQGGYSGTSPAIGLTSRPDDSSCPR